MTSGEQWAFEELGALRASGFRPHAWIRFLAASYERAADTRRSRPGLARQARRWSIAGFCAGAAVWAGATRARVPASRPARFALWWLAVAAMLDWHLGMVEGPVGEPRDRLSTADALTLLRLWSVPLLAAQGDPTRGSGPAFSSLIAAAAISDALDGPLARRAGTTRLGRDLDKVADALIVGVAARAASRAGWLPARTARLAGLRSALPVGVAAMSYFRTGRRAAVDSLGPGRRLAPVLLGGLAAAPFSPRAAPALTSAASIASLALAAVQHPPAGSDAPSTQSQSSGREAVSRSRQPSTTIRFVGRGNATSNRANRQHPAAQRADRGGARKRPSHA